MHVYLCASMLIYMVLYMAWFDFGIMINFKLRWLVIIAFMMMSRFHVFLLDLHIFKFRCIEI